MFSASALRAFALAFEGATEAPHFNRTSFRVSKRIFVTMAADGADATVKLTDPERVGELLMGRPEVFISYGGWTTRGGAVGVRLALIEEEEMKALVSEAYRGAVRPPREAGSGRRKRPT